MKRWPNRGVWHIAAEAMSLGWELALPILSGVLLGYVWDRHLETKPIFTMGLMMLVGGVFILLGWHRFIGGGLVFLAIFPAGWALHPFWKEQDPAKRLEEMAHFFKALAMAGAALLVAYYGGAYWPLSLGH